MPQKSGGQVSPPLNVIYVNDTWIICSMGIDANYRRLRKSKSSAYFCDSDMEFCRVPGGERNSVRSLRSRVVAHGWGERNSVRSLPFKNVTHTPVSLRR